MTSQDPVVISGTLDWNYHLPCGMFLGMKILLTCAGALQLAYMTKIMSSPLKGEATTLELPHLPIVPASESGISAPIGLCWRQVRFSAR